MEDPTDGVPQMLDTSLEQRAAARARHRTNLGGLAVVTLTFHTNGTIGETVVEDVGDFGVTFTEQPHVAYGYVLDGDTLVDGYFPRCSGFVIGWDTSERDLWTGAWCAFAIDGSGDEEYRIEHNFTFTGIALKDLPIDEDE